MRHWDGDAGDRWEAIGQLKRAVAQVWQLARCGVVHVQGRSRWQGSLVGVRRHGIGIGGRQASMVVRHRCNDGIGTGDDGGGVASL
ncbi:hypothetical protein E2562_028807 [Oryza meyeriana var. granulata]|uniref:Uncharacterized protein n=1 Tax=Oryza meyeriana var. granulata TaxID=110450 RepID=A0A6G1FCX8_9ORYZ|nr:hypothetical protein E2562_028807 [Oryza meyeriana var. granulata]